MNGKKQLIDKLLNSKEAPEKWNPALSNEWGRLAQGNNRGVESTNTIKFINYEEVSRDR